LMNMRYSLAHLYELLSRTAEMEELRISMTDHIDELPASNLSPITLPRLRSLALSDDCSRIAQILSMLPNPSHHLKMFCFHIDDLPAWTIVKGPDTIIIRRLLQFWSTVTGVPMAPPPGTLINFTDPNCGNIHVSSLLFESQISLQDGSGVATCLYRYPCKIIEKDTFLDHVHTLSLNCSRRTEAGLNPQCIDLSHLPNLKKLILAKVKRGPWVHVSQNEDLQTLEDWVLDRARQGRPLESVEFYQCHVRARALFKQLRRAQAARNVTWSDKANSLLELHPY
jgi:hypothetical protein